MIIPIYFSNSDVCFNFSLSIRKGQSHLVPKYRKKVEFEDSVIFKRIVFKLDLKSIYPLPANSSMTYNATFVRSHTSDNFKLPYQVVFDHDCIYFLSTVYLPATLRVIINLNSSVDLDAIQRHMYTRIFTVDLAWRKPFVFELNVSNGIDEILKAEQSILETFKSKLWPGGRLNIAYIRSTGESFKIGIASSEKHSDLLNEFCSQSWIPEEHLNIANLEVNRSNVTCNQIPSSFTSGENPPGTEYVVNAYINVGLKSLVGDRFAFLALMFEGASYAYGH